MFVRVPRRESAPSVRRLAVAVVLTSLAASTASAGDGPKGAAWASKDAAVYLEAPHPTKLLERFLEPRFQAYLATTPQYGAFLKSDKLRDLQNGVHFVETLLDTKWKDGAAKLAGGGVVFVVEIEKGKAPYGFIAVTPADPTFLKAAHAKLVAFARSQAKLSGGPDPVKEVNHRGVTLFSTGPTETHAIVADALVVSQSADAVKLVIDRSIDAPKATVADHPQWRARRDKATADTAAWGFVRLDKLREADPTKFTIPDNFNPALTFLAADWIESLRRAPWLAAEITWGDATAAAEVVVPTPPKGYSAALKTYLPPKGAGAPAPLRPKGVIGSVNLWRDLSSVWEVRSELLPPEVVQGLAQLDTVAGQYFGGRDFGAGVLGSIGTNWRIVVAEQDFSKIRPVPDLKLPAFALVIDLKPDDEEFAQRLKVAFQTFVGLTNIGAAQTKAPPLELGSEVVDGVTVATTHFMTTKDSGDTKSSAKTKEPVHQRFNFSPCAAQVGDHFFLASSIGLARDLIPILRSPTVSTDATLLVEADGASLARLVDVNRGRLITQNMLEKGNDKAAASAEVDTLAGLLRYLGRATLTAKDAPENATFRLEFQLGGK